VTGTDGGLQFSWGCAGYNMAAGDVGGIQCSAAVLIAGAVQTSRRVLEISQSLSHCTIRWCYGHKQWGAGKE
jgi:hypothetical protein